MGCFSRSRQPRTTEFSAVELRIVVRNGDGLFDQIGFVGLPFACARDARGIPPRVLVAGVDGDELFDHVGFWGVIAERIALRSGHGRSPSRLGATSVQLNDSAVGDYCDRCRASEASCSAGVTMSASGPGYTVATWSVANHRTTYGGDPSAERTSVITPR